MLPKLPVSLEKLYLTPRFQYDPGHQDRATWISFQHPNLTLLHMGCGYGYTIDGTNMVVPQLKSLQCRFPTGGILGDCLTHISALTIWGSHFNDLSPFSKLTILEMLHHTEEESLRTKLPRNLPRLHLDLTRIRYAVKLRWLPVFPSLLAFLSLSAHNIEEDAIQLIANRLALLCHFQLTLTHSGIWADFASLAPFFQAFSKHASLVSFKLSIYHPNHHGQAPSDIISRLVPLCVRFQSASLVLGVVPFPVVTHSIKST